MKKSIARLFFLAVMAGGIVLAWQGLVRAQDAGAKKPNLADEEKEGCIKNLKLIYAAIEEYQKDNKDLPNWLSDLVPKYLDDANVLICPVCKRTGRTEITSLADPKLPSSYLYEFCPLPLGSVAPAEPTKTRREWKRRQMGLVGSVVPIVRCRQHGVALNLAFDGKIYESPMNWEVLFTNIVDAASLAPEKMFPGDGAGPVSFPPRDARAKPGEIDLTSYYNAKLGDSWHGSVSNEMAGLTPGLQTLGGVEFDARGIIQLSGGTNNARKFPIQVTNIKVHQKCHTLTFLHSAGFGAVGDEDKRIGTYVIHYATSQLRLDIPIRYGHEMRNWHTIKNEPSPPTELETVWTGTNGVSLIAGQSIRLFKTTWTNVVPDVEIESIDLIGGMTMAAPFVLAITAE